MNSSNTFPALVLNPTDNVAVLLENVPARAEVQPGLFSTQRISRGHKIAIAPMAEGEPVRKFGQIIGFASKPISGGEWVHEHNCGMGAEGGAFARDYQFGAGVEPVEFVPEPERATFQGFRRSNGKVGTRNYIGILTSVNCSATVARYIAEAVERSGMLDDYPTIDGIVSFVHSTGCGMSGKGEGFDILSRTQWGYAANPNLGAALMVGLGCEVFQIGRMKQKYGIAEDETFQTLTIQGEGGTRKAIEQGVERVRAMLPIAARAERETIPASELILALQCGGSDGYSGITANPALGVAVDMLVRQGGTAILSETSEIYGAEHLLTRRAADRAIGEKLIERIHWWEDYCDRNGGEMNNNPSPGNKAGGLTTILEKSLGAAAKGGTTPLMAVYEYAEPVTERGFVFMDTPGFDPVSATGQVAGGANVLCFTTGRGSAFGCKPVPSIKLATNSDLYARMTEDMDINCGDILEGVTLEQKGAEIFQHILDVASGRTTKSEDLGYGDNEFAPWQVGAVM
ncbi:altronate dehydratase family protein [Pelagibacterium flavum]|uniref:Altronate dehydratase family protein n=1 Tax=Pelagibacterium flavum TaxID=2984530 RepID=A0ABY6IKJ2_9HYPH|nr:altronate dehydratase family protein [Pelagibacterium sp. YIM 151497]UYQ71083.1 altronate dehydratase family protein [Pelagibacterium sp. YIM 151497]